MDIRTFYIALTAVLALYTLALTLLRSSERDLVGTRWMAYSFGSATLGIGLATLRGMVWAPVSIIGGNLLIVLGYLCLHRAILEFLGLAGRRDRRLGLVLVAATVIGTVLLTFGIDDLRSRIILVGIAIGCQVGLSGIRLLREGKESGARVATRFLGSVLLLLAGSNLFRSAWALLYPSGSDLMAGGAMEAFMGLAFLLGATSTAFGFVWMTSARLSTQLHRDANTDPLTGLLNRRGFLAMAPMRITLALAEGQRLLLLFADIDGLKQVNDTIGHDAGDRMIAEAAQLFREVLRASDLIARLGGDEFCALVAVPMAMEPEIILDRLERRIRERARRPGRESTFDLSAAVTELDSAQDRPLEEWLRLADERMYEVKRAHKARGALLVC